MNSFCNPFQTSSKQEEKLEDRNRKIWKEENKTVQIISKTR